jgi:hypothetical protein
MKKIGGSRYETDFVEESRVSDDTMRKTNWNRGDSVYQLAINSQSAYKGGLSMIQPPFNCFICRIKASQIYLDPLTFLSNLSDSKLFSSSNNTWSQRSIFLKQKLGAFCYLLELD